MARQDVLRLFCFSLVACDLIARTHSTSFPHVCYEYALESERICHPLGKKTTTEISNKAVTVKPRHMFDRWSVNLSVHCKFVFKAGKGDGLFAVIQKMSFRRNETHCIDFVQFKRKDNHLTEKFCGNFDRSKDGNIEAESANSVYVPGSSFPATYAEFDPSTRKSGGELETEIFINKEKLNPGEQLALSIVYTPYKNCSTVDPEEYKTIGFNACIRKEFFCDGIYNCIPNKFFKSDETDCPNRPHEVVSSGAGTNVTVGAVTTMILCFIIFVMCLWICKRSQKLCWSSDCAGPVVVCSRPGTLPRDAEAYVHPAVPSAPMLEVAVTPSVPDKDLPPSYDSLFPEQSTLPARS